MSNFVDKLLGVLISRRFWAVVMGVLLILFTDVFNLTEEQAQTIIALIMSWIIGDSVSKTDRVSVSFKVKNNE